MTSFADFVRMRGGAPDPPQPAPATRALPSVPAQPQAVPAPPKVLLVTTANLFVWDGSNRTVDMTKRPTGGLTLTHALTRHVHALGGSIVAVDFVRDDYDEERRRWEGIPIKCVRRGAAMHLSADVVVTTSLALDVVNWAAAHCEGRYCAMCHDYSGAPWGPFGHVDAKQQTPLRDALAGWNLLCDSKHVAAYHERFGPANVTPRLCYGASYGYFRAPPLYRHAVAAEYVTFISPCAPKGLSILAAIAPRLPQVKFLCVATAWTNAVVQHILKRFPNVVVEAGAPDVDVFYRRTKVLLVPSIWPEAFGLVATEAAARGIPVVSTDFGGLTEANPVERLRLSTRWFYDHAAFKLLRCHLDDAMELPQADPPADVLDSSGDERRERVAKHLFHCLLHVAPKDVADAFVETLTRLLADDAFYADAARDSREGAMAFIERYDGTFLDVVKGVLLRRPLVG